MTKFAYVALVSAAMSLVVSAPAMAQDAAAMTSGGDVTAEEATPLPPVVVEAPSQPLARKKKQAKSIGSAGSSPAATAPQQGPATTGEAAGTGTAGVGIYTLGQLDLIFRVPLYMDGVRMYLPADNRSEPCRFAQARLPARAG